jgi:hypothetical protein
MAMLTDGLAVRMLAAWPVGPVARFAGFGRLGRSRRGVMACANKQRVLRFAQNKDIQKYFPFS